MNTHSKPTGWPVASNNPFRQVRMRLPESLIRGQRPIVFDFGAIFDMARGPPGRECNANLQMQGFESLICGAGTSACMRTQFTPLLVIPFHPELAASHHTLLDSAGDVFSALSYSQAWCIILFLYHCGSVLSSLVDRFTLQDSANLGSPRVVFRARTYHQEYATILDILPPN